MRGGDKIFEETVTLTWRGIWSALVSVLRGQGVVYPLNEVLLGRRPIAGVRMSGACGTAIDDGKADVVKVDGVKIHLHKRIC